MDLVLLLCSLSGLRLASRVVNQKIFGSCYSGVLVGNKFRGIFHCSVDFITHANVGGL